MERVNKTLQDVVAKHLHEKDPTMWDEALPAATFAINTAPHCETGESPHSLFFGRMPQLPLALSDATNDRSEHERFEAFRRIYENTANNLQKLQRDRQYRPGDLVLVYRPAVPFGCPKKFSMPWKGPFPVVRDTGFMKYVLKDGTTEFVAHQTQLKPYFDTSLPSQASTQTSTSHAVDARRLPISTPHPDAGSDSRINQRYGLRPRVFRPSRLVNGTS